MLFVFLFSISLSRLIDLHWPFMWLRCNSPMAFGAFIVHVLKPTYSTRNTEYGEEKET